MFGTLTRNQLQKFSYFFNEMTCNKDMWLYKENLPADKVYIVKDGTF